MYLIVSKNNPKITFCQCLPLRNTKPDHDELT